MLVGGIALLVLTAVAAASGGELRFNLLFVGSWLLIVGTWFASRDVRRKPRDLTGREQAIAGCILVVIALAALIWRPGDGGWQWLAASGLLLGMGLLLVGVGMNRTRRADHDERGSGPDEDHQQAI
jgi:hypothetical protein